MQKVYPNRLPVVISCLMIFSAATVLPDKIVGRNLFYLATALTALMFIVQRKWQRIGREDILLACAFFCVGLSQFIWTKRFPAEANSIFMADLNYPRTSAYMLMSGLLILMTPVLSGMIDFTRKKRLLFSLLVLAGFCYLSGRGLAYTYAYPGERLRIDSAPTLSAYLFLLQSLMTTHILRVMGSKGKQLMIAVVIVLSVLVLLFTQTRSVLILYPFLLVLYMLINRLWSWRRITGGGILALLVVSLVVGLFFKNVQERMNQAFYEVSEYSTNNDTSIGARFSMWHSGLYAFAQHPLGQSAATRFTEVKNYMDTREHGNAEGLRNSVYHLHNDVIDSSSLQGIAGGAGMIFLFSALVFFFYRKKALRTALPLSILPIVLMGSGDTLFINDRFVVMFCMQICLFALTATVSCKEETAQPTR